MLRKLAPRNRAHLHARNPSQIAGPDAVLLDEVRAEARTGISLYEFRRLRGLGIGPVITKIGRSVKYHVDDLDTWLKANRVDPQDYAAATRAASAKRAAGRTP